MAIRSQFSYIFSLGSALFCLAISLCTDCRAEGFMKIYYMPFGIQTYVPVTKEDIEKRALYRLNVPQSSKDAIKILGLLDSGHETDDFNNQVVRLKVVTSAGRSYYADSMGNVEALSKRSRISLNDLEKVIDKLIGTNTGNADSKGGHRGRP
jgi:hypothetical protein